MLDKKAKKGIKLSLDLVCNCALVIGAIVLIVALALSGDYVKAFNVLVIVACAIYVLASLALVIKAIMVIVDKKVNRRSPEYKGAIKTLVVMGLIFAVAVFGLVWVLTL